MIERMTRAWKHYTADEQEYIRLHDDRTPQRRQEIANHLGRSVYSVKHQCERMSLHRWRKDEFTEEEIEYVREHIGRLTAQTIGKRLHRSRKKIIMLCKDLNIGRNYRDTWFNTNDVAFGLGCARAQVVCLIHDGKLKAKQDPEDKRHHWYITRKSIRDYIINHPMELDSRNCDMVFLVSILVGDDLVYGSEKE